MRARMSRKGCAYETDLAMRGLFQVLKWGKWDLNILGNNTNGKHKKITLITAQL